MKKNPGLFNPLACLIFTFTLTFPIFSPSVSLNGQETFVFPPEITGGLGEIKTPSPAKKVENIIKTNGGSSNDGVSSNQANSKDQSYVDKALANIVSGAGGAPVTGKAYSWSTSYKIGPDGKKYEVKKSFASGEIGNKSNETPKITSPAVSVPQSPPPPLPPLLAPPPGQTADSGNKISTPSTPGEKVEPLPSKPGSIETPASKETVLDAPKKVEPLKKVPVKKPPYLIASIYDQKSDQLALFNSVAPIPLKYPLSEDVRLKFQVGYFGNIDPQTIKVTLQDREKIFDNASYADHFGEEESLPIKSIKYKTFHHIFRNASPDQYELTIDANDQNGNPVSSLKVPLPVDKMALKIRKIQESDNPATGLNYIPTSSEGHYASDGTLNQSQSNPSNSSSSLEGGLMGAINYDEYDSPENMDSMMASSEGVGDLGGGAVELSDSSLKMDPNSLGGGTQGKNSNILEKGSANNQGDSIGSVKGDTPFQGNTSSGATQNKIGKQGEKSGASLKAGSASFKSSNSSVRTEGNPLGGNSSDNSGGKGGPSGVSGFSGSSDSGKTPSGSSLSSSHSSKSSNSPFSSPSSNGSIFPTGKLSSSDGQKGAQGEYNPNSSFIDPGNTLLATADPSSEVSKTQPFNSLDREGNGGAFGIKNLTPPNLSDRSILLIIQDGKNQWMFDSKGGQVQSLKVPTSLETLHFQAFFGKDLNPGSEVISFVGSGGTNNFNKEQVRLPVRVQLGQNGRFILSAGIRNSQDLIILTVKVQ